LKEVGENLNPTKSRKLIIDGFELGENIIYIVIAILLFLVTLFLIYDAARTLIHYPTASSFVRWVVEILNKILLMLMVLEILYTVRISYTEHTLCAEPFLIVALIAAIRRILVISVETAYFPELFQHHMVEIGILGVLIFIFVISMVFMHKKMPPKQNQSQS